MNDVIFGHNIQKYILSTIRLHLKWSTTITDNNAY